MLVVGDPGSGKTRILRELEERPPAGRRSLYVPVSTLTFEDLARWCLVSLGHAAGADPGGQFEAQLADSEQPLLLLIDDADHLPTETALALGRIAASAPGQLAVVAATCPGKEEKALAKSLETEERVVLTEALGALLHLGELHDLLGSGRRTSRMLRVPPRTEMVVPVAEVPAEASKRSDTTAAELPMTPLAPVDPEPAPTTPQAWVRTTLFLLTGCLLILIAYELGRRSADAPSAPAPPTLPVPSATRPAPVADETTILDEPTPVEELPPVAAAPPAEAPNIDPVAPPPEATVSRDPAIDPPVVTRVARADDGWIDIEVIGPEQPLAWIDGAHVGTTPVVRAAASPGSHRVTLRRQDGTRLLKTVEVESNKSSRVRIYLD